MKALNAFQGEEHQPFYWAGGQKAALLVHGFPGTAAELRPLGTALHQAGWTVHGLLLPGFGPDIVNLGERDPKHWLVAIQTALLRLRLEHEAVLLIGYSMGAALALQVAAMQPPSGLVLLAPFRQLGTTWQNIIGALLSPFFRQVQPFKKANFSDPKTREGLTKFFNDLDLDDRAVQQALRELRLPTRVFKHLNQTGRDGHRAAPQVTSPSLVIQGSQDEIVTPTTTRRLVEQLPATTRYLELAAEHDLLNPERPGWTEIEQAILNFAHQTTSQSVTSHDR
ncbi:MAG: alpha/beta fold hydrolase [Anaerolineae bacterium]|nr:alpha/beta fold hydrolase [Anaerolineae bacterium]